MAHAMNPTVNQGETPNSPLANNLFTQISSNSASQVLSALSAIIAILLKLQLQEQKQAYLNVETSCESAQATAKAQIANGEYQSKEAVAQAAIAGAGATSMLAGLGSGIAASRSTQVEITQEKAQLDNLNKLDSQPRTSTSLAGGTMPVSRTFADNEATQELVHNTNQADPALLNQHAETINGMNDEEYAQFKGNLHDNINARTEHLGGLYNDRQSATMRANTAGQLGNSAATTVGQGVTAGYKLGEGQQQANQTISSQAQNAEAAAYGNNVQAMDKTLSIIEGVIQGAYQAAKTYPQGG